MTPPTETESREQCLQALVAESIETEKELAVAFERSVEVDPDSGEAIEIEDQVAGLLERSMERRGGVIGEAQRQGVRPGDLEALFIGGGAPDDLYGGQDSLTRWRRAAETGRAPAQFVLGEILVGNLGGAPGHRPEFEEAVKWLREAKRQDCGPAVLELSRLHLAGQGVRRDRERAFRLLERAAELGVNDARYQLGMAYVTGDGVAPSIETGKKWLEKGAADGHVDSQLHLGLLHAYGGSGEIEHAEAVRWLSKASAEHRHAAIEWLELYRDMSPADYEKAVYLETWSPENAPPPERAGCAGYVIALGFLVLLIAAALRGNSVGLFLLILFAVVVFHEAGHWLGGRLVGIPILVFGIGVGPLLRSFYLRGRRYTTRFDLRLLPLLGYVQPYTVPRRVWDYWQKRFRARDQGQPPPPLPEFDKSEDPQPVAKFVSRPRRLVYYLGGLAVNFALAVVCLSVYENLSEVGRSVTSPIAGRVPEGSVAERAGLEEGDRFLRMEGDEVIGFFDVQRRLAPMSRSGAAEPLVDAPGTRVSLEILRGGRELTLEWPTPPEPPKETAEAFYGLIPPESWRLDRVHESAADLLEPDDVIRAFEVSGRRISTAEPGAHALLRQAFATAGEGRIRLVIERDGQERTISVAPRTVAAGDTATSGDAPGAGEDTDLAPPFQLARLREPGPPTGLGEILARVGAFGRLIIVELPGMVARAVKEPPSEEEKGWLLRAVKKDPWSAVRLFAILNLFLLFFNLLPIPPLDGFHAGACVIEMVIRRDLPQRGISILVRIGWLLILAWLALNAFLLLRDLVGTFF